MADYVSPNLPSRDFDKTETFYAKLGFKARVKIENWMILARDKLVLEFFPMPNLAADQSWFGACLHVDDLDALHAGFAQAGLPAQGVPRLTAPYLAPFGLRKFEMIDADGSLLHCIENPKES